MQKYGKTLNDSRFSPIFYTFAEDFNKYMKYLKTIFTLTWEKEGETHDATIMQAAKDVLCECLGNIGYEAFEESGGNSTTGYIQANAFNENSLNACVNAFPLEGIVVAHTTQDVEDKNWNKAWEENGFAPIWIKDKCVIHDPMHPIGQTTSGVIDITIDTKQAFGTGGHETTFMIVNELFNMEMQGKSVLDCGCGTGILSIVSAKLGAGNVTAYDIDDWSVENTKHNCSLNGVCNINIKHGDASVLKAIDKKSDIVLANINRNILLADMSSFRNAMADGGILILSGFYTQDADLLINHAKELNLNLSKQATRNNWCMLKFQAADMTQSRPTEA